jgi:hypothetical protein
MPNNGKPIADIGTVIEEVIPINFTENHHLPYLNYPDSSTFKHEQRLLNLILDGFKVFGG